MPIRTLAEAISHYGHEAYLLTVAKDGPHTSNVTVELRAAPSTVTSVCLLISAEN